MSHQPISEKKRLGVGGRIGLFVLGFGLVIGSILLLWFVFLGPWLMVNQAAEWPAVPCTITSSEIEVHRGDDSTSYSPEISFRYKVNGRTHTSDDYSFYSFSGGHSWARRVVNQHPVGKQVQCFYDPDQPDRAVLNRGFFWSSLWGLIGFVLGPLGVFLSYKAIRGSSRTYQSPVETFSTASEPGESEHYDTLFSSEWQGPQKLKPAQTRHGRLIGTALFAVVWNGFLAVFLYFWLSSGQGGGFGGVFFWIVMIPFVIVGFVAVGSVIHALLGLSNPTVEVALSNGIAMPGTELDVAWETHGKARRFRSLTLTIEAEEQATYTRGTNTYTDKETRFKLPVVDTTNHEQMQFGQKTVAIPNPVIHSFEANNNKIIWMIRIHGDIPRWPDVKEEYKFRVKPQ